MRGRKSSYTLTLAPEELVELTALVRRHNAPAGLVARARALLLVAEGKQLSVVAQRVGKSRRYVYKWLVRYYEGGIHALQRKQHTRKSTSA
jgi:transposase